MDAVELPYPVDVAVPKIMGSEGFGRAGVTVKEVEARESDSVPILVSRTVERCSSLTSQKGDVIMSDVTSSAHAAESSMMDKIPDIKFSRNSCKLPSFQEEDVSQQVQCGDSSCLSTTRLDGTQLHQRSTKILKSNTLCSKRQGIIQLESTSLAVVDDVKDICDRLESCPSRCTSSEKILLVKQKNHLHSKRSEKRCPRVPAKGKYDSLPVKVGSASFGAASGGSNFLGLYGLKSDAPDATKLIDDFSLIGLLDGTYEAPNLGKDKGKKETNTNETLLHSIRKAGSILESHRPTQPQKFAEVDGSSYKKGSTFTSTALSCGANGDREEACMTDPTSCDKVSSSKPETPSDVLDFPLYQPKDVLERLALPPPRDLESLLLDAAKPTVSSRNTPDPRPGKQVTRRPSLPAFQWSYTFSGQSRTNADTIKLSSSRNTCQGRWGRIGNTPISVGVANDCFSNLDSLKYDNNLIPSNGLKPPGGLPWFEWCSSSTAPQSKSAHLSTESGGGLKYEENADDCPRILAAAQTLMNLGALSTRQNKDGGLTTWQKKASQKSSRVRKSRVSEKGQETSKPPIPFSGSDNLSRIADHGFPSKKPKLSTMEKKKDLGANSLRKVPVTWSTPSPRSVRSSPGKSERDSISETRHPCINVAKLSSMMPPPARVSDNKPSDTEHKMRSSVMDPIAETRHSSANTFKQSYSTPPPARPSDSEHKRKASDIEERPRSSVITNWHYGHSSPHTMKQSSLMPPPPRTAEKTRDSEHKLKKLMVDWNSSGGRDSAAETRHYTKQACTIPPPGRAFDKACDGEDRPRKLTVDKIMDWRNFDKTMD